MKINSYLRTFRALIRNYMSVVKIVDRYPDLQIELPGKFVCDDFAAVEMGRGIHIGCYSEIIIMHRCKESKIAGRLIIGDRVIIGAFCNIRACGGQIRIGKNTACGQHVSLIAGGHVLVANSVYRDLPWDEKRTDVLIGDNVFIFAGAVILPGVQIGENSVVGAGAVVTHNIPANEIWAGIPAKKLRNV